MLFLHIVNYTLLKIIYAVLKFTYSTICDFPIKYLISAEIPGNYAVLKMT